MFFISIKEINWLISKEMSNIYLLRTTGCSQNFDFLKKTPDFRSIKKINLIEHIIQKYCLILLKLDHFCYAAIFPCQKVEMI